MRNWWSLWPWPGQTLTTYQTLTLFGNCWTEIFGGLPYEFRYSGSSKSSSMPSGIHPTLESRPAAGRAGLHWAVARRAFRSDERLFLLAMTLPATCPASCCQKWFSTLNSSSTGVDPPCRTRWRQRNASLTESSNQSWITRLQPVCHLRLRTTDPRSRSWGSNRTTP